jgi:hypothetical protein
VVPFILDSREVYQDEPGESKQLASDVASLELK